MSQAEAIRREPNLKRFTEAEIDQMLDKIYTYIDNNRIEEAEKLMIQVPMLPKSAKIMKEMVGIDEMISMGVNLSEAVDEYGYEWLSK